MDGMAKPNHLFSRRVARYRLGRLASTNKKNIWLHILLGRLAPTKVATRNQNILYIMHNGAKGMLQVTFFSTMI